MKLNNSFINFFLACALLSGVTSSCSMTQEKKLRSKGLTLMYKSRTAVGQELANIRLRKVQLSEEQVDQHLRSLKYEDLSLFGKKKPVFSPEGIDRMARLVTKAINHAPANKIVYFDLDTPSGATAGVVFPTNKVLNWKFSSIRGSSFSSRSLVSWGGNNWRLVAQRGQQYHSAQKLLSREPQENWIKIPIPKISERQLRADPNPSPSRAKRKSGRIKPKPAPEEESTSVTDPDLEKKLQFLKDLYEKNLVDEEEYNRKRKELLDTYL
ncbi:MAG: SHOCT domain-containing protein [Nitrospinae bacterium]|nr:SHOCT domain-containing protein [Nitrospinota bacterium]